MVRLPPGKGCILTSRPGEHTDRGTASLRREQPEDGLPSVLLLLLQTPLRGPQAGALHGFLGAGAGGAF